MYTAQVRCDGRLVQPLEVSFFLLPDDLRTTPNSEKDSGQRRFQYNVLLISSRSFLSAVKFSIGHTLGSRRTTDNLNMLGRSLLVVNFYYIW